MRWTESPEEETAEAGASLAPRQSVEELSKSGPQLRRVPGQPAIEGGLLGYSGKLSVGFCWTGGPEPQIYNVGGNMTASNYFPAEVSNAIGPATQNRVAIEVPP